MASGNATQDHQSPATPQRERSLTKADHNKSYPSISPLRPELSQAGRTVLIAGASSGIGYAIAASFARASASRIILVGRHIEALEAAKAKLRYELRLSPLVAIDTRACDMTELYHTKRLWADLAAKGVSVDVLVLNAASLGPIEPILKSGAEKVWQEFFANVRPILDFTERFYKQGASHRPKYLVNVSTSAIHRWEDHGPERPSYGLTKSAGTLAVQQIARDTPKDAMQIISFHPGAVLTDAARRTGMTESSWVWDQADLPGDFAVWAASPEAAFLHGRFVWSRWDVDELARGELRERIDKDPYFLRIGVVGAAGY
ncbi:related to peroxisomal short-chain alcohol dehydrogenase [Cephalotrichum gorgonifer]|uniref:Related to peroxisomal short-chain alcohol dehydrogenase n=1 Tax=Cephalotrichum gorgonifer TaxID=2041049 RepID=A0AAE8MZ79_9PEZI|nr:related to peroxisomal short-chain alcohol dehydrogenase [Cephalotrichum gorgonifer]